VPPDLCLYLRCLLLRGWRETGEEEEKVKGRKGRGGGRDLAHPKILVWRPLCIDTISDGLQLYGSELHDQFVSLERHMRN